MLHPDSTDQLALRDLLLEAAQDIIRAEGGKMAVREVRIVPGAEFLDHTYGTAILLPTGDAALRIAVGRPAAEVVDTVLHELAHVLLGPEHVDRPDHGASFQAIYERLRERYAPGVQERLR